MFITVSFAVFSLLLVSSASAQYKYTFPTQCNVTDVTISQNQARQGIVSYLFIGNGQSVLNCGTRVNIVTMPNHHITLRFTRLYIDGSRGAYVMVEGNRSSESYSGKSKNAPSMYSSGNYLSVTYYSGKSASTWTDQSLEFYYTSYTKGKCSKYYDGSDDTRDHDDDDDDDDHDGFHCWNDRCIDEDLKCDSYDNCGDWSDESMWTCGLSEAVIIAIAVTSSIVGLTLIIGIALCCVQQAKKKRNKTTPAGSCAGDTSSLAEVESREPVNLHRHAMPAPPPYTYNNAVMTYVGGEANAGWAAPYGELDFDGGKPPQYQEVTADPKTQK